MLSVQMSESVDNPDHPDCPVDGSATDLMVQLEEQRIVEDEQEVIEKWVGVVQPELRAHILQEVEGGITVREFNEKFQREGFHQDTRPWNNINELIKAGVAMRTTVEGNRGYCLTQLGELIHRQFRSLLAGIRVADGVEPFLKGIPEPSRDNDRFIPDLDVLAEYASFDVQPDSDSDLYHGRLLAQFLDGHERVRIVTPWPGIRGIDAFDRSSNARHEYIITKTFLERREPNNLRGSVCEEILDSGSRIALNEYRNRFPYMLVLAEEDATYGTDFAECGRLAIWGKGDIDDNYSIFVETDYPDLLRWGENLYTTIEEKTAEDLTPIE